MKRKLKYAATVMLLIVCTAVVMIFPSFYYDSSDSAMEKNAQINTLGILEQKKQITCAEAYSLMLSDNSTQMVIDSNTVTKEDILLITEKALKDLLEGCEEESSFYFLLNYFLSRLDKCTIEHSLSLIIGELDGDVASLTVADVTVNYYDEYSDAYEDYDDYVVNGNVTLYMHVNCSTAQMYNMSVVGTQKISNEYEEYYDLLDEENRSKADASNDEFDVISHLVDYWDVPEKWVVVEEYDHIMIFTVQPSVYDDVTL